MKFIMRMKKKGTPDSSAWDEPYERDNVKDIEGAREYAQEMVKRFNNSLRKHEQPRVLVDVVVDESSVDSKAAHNWSKTNLMTQVGQYGSYDAYKCEDCGITGKRYGVRDVTRDSKYRAKVYARCDTAQAQLKKLEQQRREREYANSVY